MDAPVQPDHWERAHRLAVWSGVVVGAAGAVASAVTNRYAPAFLADAGFGILFALECLYVEWRSTGDRIRRALRASVRAAWGLTFAIWSALLYAFATRILRGLGVKPSSSPGQAHADLKTHLEAAAVFIVVVALATALTTVVLSISSSPRRFIGASIRAGAASCLIGGVFIAVGFPERPWLAAGGACAAAATWHALMGRAIFARPAHSRAATGNDTGLR